MGGGRSGRAISQVLAPPSSAAQRLARGATQRSAIRGNIRRPQCRKTERTKDQQPQPQPSLGTSSCSRSLGPSSCSPSPPPSPHLQRVDERRHRVACPRLFLDQPFQIVPVSAGGQRLAHSANRGVHLGGVRLDERRLQANGPTQHGGTVIGWLAARHQSCLAVLSAQRPAPQAPQATGQPSWPHPIRPPRPPLHASTLPS